MLRDCSFFPTSAATPSGSATDTNPPKSLLLQSRTGGLDVPKHRADPPSEISTVATLSGIASMISDEDDQPGGGDADDEYNSREIQRDCLNRQCSNQYMFPPRLPLGTQGSGLDSSETECASTGRQRTAGVVDNLELVYPTDASESHHAATSPYDTSGTADTDSGEDDSPWQIMPRPSKIRPGQLRSSLSSQVQEMLAEHVGMRARGSVRSRTFTGNLKGYVESDSDFFWTRPPLMRQNAFELESAVDFECWLRGI